MKEIRKEVKREVVDVYVRYEAFDGTQFPEKEECEKYENSALGAVMKRMQAFTVASNINSEHTINPFDDDNLYMCVVPKTPSDIDTLNHFWVFRECTKLSDVPFTDKHIGIPLLIGYRFTDNSCCNLDWCWYHNLNVVIDTMTGGKFKLVENNEK